jgi:hypothetical protein
MRSDAEKLRTSQKALTEKATTDRARFQAKGDRRQEETRD